MRTGACALRQPEEAQQKRLPGTHTSRIAVGVARRDAVHFK